MTEFELIKSKAENVDYLLIGIGTQFADENDDIKGAYKSLLELVDGKNYFIITEDTSDILEESGFNTKRVTAPVKEYEINGNTADEQWDLYTKWITATINRSTCILELGVSLAQPNLIRWPFEKMASLNYKSEFIRVNKKLPFLPENLAEKGVAISKSPAEVLLKME